MSVVKKYNIYTWIGILYFILTYKLLSRVLSARGNNNVDSSDLTREFIWTIAEITRNSYNTQFRAW
jgi:hypothetical protein